MPCMRS
jgi:hypothetical protein